MTIVFLGLAGLLVIVIIINFLIPKGLNLREINGIIDSGDYEKAKILLQKNISNKRFSPDAHFLMAKVYSLTSQFEYTLMELKSIIKNNKFGVIATKDEIYNMLGETYLKLGRLEDAYQQYLILEQDYPEEYNVAIHLGKILFKKKEYEQAINYFNKALKLRGTDSESIGGLGMCYFQLGDFPKAHEFLDQAVKLNRKNFMAHYYFALYFHKKQLFDTAISEYEKALTDKSLRLNSLYGMARCYQEKEVNVRAIEYYEEAVRFIEQTADKIRDYNKRINYLQNPLFLEIRYRLSEAHQFDKNYAAAIEQWQEIESVSPDYKDIRQKITENARYGKDRVQDFLIVKEMDFEKIARYMVSYLGYIVKKLDMKEKEEIFIEAQGNTPDVYQGISYILIKRGFNPVGERDITGFYQKMEDNEINRGIVISAHGFSPTAIRFGLNKPIDFVGKNQVMRLLKRYEYRL